MRPSFIVSLVSLAAVSFAIALPRAKAFPHENEWHQSASARAGTGKPGAGGIYGTGGQTDFGVKCSHCHIPDPAMPSRIDVRVDAAPAFQDLGGGDLGYVPGQRYAITINLLNENRHATPPGQDKNGFAATVENASGRRAGRFISDSGQDSASCPSTVPITTDVQRAGRTSLLYGDCHGVLFIARPFLTQWRYDWIAPSSGSGELKMFVGVVDGDAGGDSSLGDDAKEIVLPLLEGS